MRPSFLCLFGALYTFEEREARTNTLWRLGGRHRKIGRPWFRVLGKGSRVLERGLLGVGVITADKSADLASGLP